MANNKGPFSTSAAADKLARILAALKAKPISSDDLADLTAMSRRTANRYLRHLSGDGGARRVVRVARYTMTNQRVVPLYALGSAPDAVWPKRCEIERQRQRRAKAKTDPELLIRSQNYEKARWAREKAKRTPSTWFSALMGA